MTLAAPRRLWVFLTLLAGIIHSVFALAQAPQGKPVTIRGKISAVDKESLKVATSAGDVPVRLADNVRIGGIETAKLSDISVGKFVGTTALKQADGSLKPLEVTM